MTYFSVKLQNNPSRIVDTVKPKNHAGFVYVKVGEESGVPIYEMRKPDPFERKCILISYLKAHSGEMIKVPYLADKLGVTDRTLQILLKELVKEEHIISYPSNGKDGRQTGNIYVWTAKKDPVIGGPTLKELYSKKDNYGFRSFTWEDFKVIPGQYNSIEEKIEKYYQYMDLIAIKKRLKRKHDSRRKKAIMKLHGLKVRDVNEIPY